MNFQSCGGSVVITSTSRAGKTRSPRTSRSVRFTYVDPQARDVRLAGDFTGWAADRIRFENDGNGGWSATVDLAPGEHQYKLVVDGQWRTDPKCDKCAPNPFGTENSVLIVK